MRAKTNLLGLRGLGERGNPGLGAAIASAAANATSQPGHNSTALPLGPARVFTAGGRSAWMA